VKEMSDQTRGVIFVVAVLAITFIWVHYFQPTQAPQKPAQAISQAAPAQTGMTSPAAAAGAAATSQQTPVSSKPVAIPSVQASSEKSVVVESPLYRVELSNRGGVVRSWRLKKYFDDQKIPQPLELVNQSAAQQLGWPFSLVLADKQLENEANSALYEVTPVPSDAVATASAPADITLHWSDGHLDVTKKLHFKQDYETTVEVNAALDGKPLAPALAWRGGFGDQAVYKASQLVSVFYKQNDKLTLLQYKKLGVPNNQAQPAEVAGPLQFAGIEDQFFTAAFLPAGANLSQWHWTQDHTTSGGASEPEAEMAVGASDPGPLEARIYVGPKDLVLLVRERPSLEELINFGWFGVISKPLLFVLQWIHKFVPNYGWAIVALTLALTLLLAPLRIWSFRSARKMQAVGPEIKSIQDRYKKYSMSDPRKRQMNDEVMAVYQREGINPASGCLPMLPQIPLLFAFYRMLAGAIELRHAPWIWWIHDLSAKDPYYVLPIVMVITSYLMTKMTPMPSGGDPSQQKMMMLMPVFMGFIFFNLSSGLNLYYFTSNLVGVVQQWYLNKHNPLPSRSKFKNKKKE
jgi:YidC/Oxa1 family membrane protein insertase